MMDKEFNIQVKDNRADLNLSLPIICICTTIEEEYKIHPKISRRCLQGRSTLWDM